MTIFSFLNQAVNKYSDRQALRDAGGEWLTYRDIEDISLRLEEFLKGRGVPAGGTIAIDMIKSPDYAVSVLSCLLGGYCIVPLNNDYPKERKKDILNDSRADFVLTHKDYAAALKTPLPDLFLQAIGEMQKEEKPKRSHEPCEEDIAAYIFTSGSTGRPKGVMLSQRSIAEQVKRNNRVVRLRNGDTWGQVASFTFIAGIVEILVAITSGAKAILIDAATLRNPKELAEFYYENDITASFIPPRVLSFFEPKSDKIRLIVAASERLTGVAPKGYRLINEYGQSELCGASLFFEVDKAYDNTPIGKPFDGTYAYVLDEDGNEAEEGELCLSGHFFSGYVNLPEQTEKVLIKNPFYKKDGYEMMVRTGDIVRRNPDGNIVYINRNDWMIKLNGQRVEPGEIENVILKAGGVKEAAVKDFKNESGQVYICAYFCGDTDAETLKEEIGKHLPSYMIPAFFVKLPKLPQNANGKLDRLSLKAPDANTFKSEYAAPESDNEKIICRAFEKALNVERVGINDDFFAMGGDSVKTIEAAALCEGISLSTEMIFKGRTPGAIAALIGEEADDKEALTLTIVHGSNIPKSCPMTDSQKGVYFECMDEPDSLKYNIPGYIRIPGDVKTSDYEAAVKAVFSVHPSLSVKTGMIDYTPSMFYEKQEALISHTAAEDIKAECARFVRPFDLEADSLYRFEICTIKDERYFFFDFHHIIFDGTSLNVFVTQLEAALKGELPIEEALNIFDIANYEKELHLTEKYAEDLRFFDEKLSEMDGSSLLISDKLAEECGEKGAGSADIYTDAFFTKEEALDFTRSRAITENTLFLGAFAYTLAKFNGGEQCGFSTVNNGRHDTRLKDTVGMFVKTLPLYYEIDENLRVSDFLTMVQQDFFATMCHDGASLGDIAKNHNITDNINFVYQSDMLNGAVEIDSGEISAPICVMVFKCGNVYRINIRYYKRLYSHEFMESFALSFAQTLEQMMRVESLCEIDILSRPQKSLLDEFNRTECDYDLSKTIVDLFEEQVHAHPNNTAVIFDDKEITYAEADEISSAIAAYLADEGIKRGDVVSVLIPRCEYMVTASLGVLKCGAAYQPLDPTYPNDRLEFMMRDGSVKLVIADEHLMEKIPNWNGKTLYTKDILRLTKEYLTGEHTLPKPPAPEDVLILLYTSGSTGVPKGCMIRHGNLTAFCSWYRRYYKLTAKDRVAAYASYGFDACMMDMYTALSTGGATVIIREDMRFDLLKLNSYFKEKKITHCFMTTQVGRQFAQLCDSKYLKHLSVGGEALTPLCVDKQFAFYNVYGPTENTIFTTSFLVDKKYKRVPIGSPVDNVKLYVTDKHMRCLPQGAVGELCIAGRQISAGYLNRPEKTAEVYIDNPFCDQSGYEKLYRTGDIVRLLPDGNVDFIGRNDRQVKIRGFRIELSEIEEVIRRYPGITDATVADFDAQGGGKFVAAYIVADTQIDIKALNSFIGETKPSYMIPAVTMQLDEIPLNQNMKVNKKALPVPEFKAAETDLTKPETETEKKLFEIVSDMLKNNEFGIHTDFSELGMTSISSIRLITEIGEKLNAVVRFADMKRYNNISTLAGFIDETGGKSDELPVLDEYPLTKTQMGIFAECIARPESAVYNIPVIIGLNPAIDIDRLKSAIAAAVNAHPYIMTTFKYNEKGEVLKLREPKVYSEDEILIKTVSDLDEIKGEMLKPFKLIGGRLFCFGIYTEGESGSRYFVLNMHHVISDGTSINLMLRDISRAYKGDELKSETYSGFEVSLEEARLCKSGAFNESKAFYKEMLSGCEGCAMPPKTVSSDTEGSAEVTYISGEKAGIYKDFCNEHGITMNTLFNCAFALALGRYTYKEDVTYCTIYNGRNDSRTSAVVSMLVKTFPVRIAWDKDTGVAEYLAKMEDILLQCMANDIYSFAEISHDYHIDADILYSYQGDNFAIEDFCGLESTEVSMELNAAKAPLDISVEIKEDVIFVHSTYRSDMYDELFVKALSKSIFTAALNLIASEKLSDIVIADDFDIRENRRLNDIAYPVADEPVYKMFERKAVRHPDKVAVIDNEQSLTYAKLNEKCNILANTLIDLGVNKDEIIGFICERSINIFIGEYGIIKSGGAFLPMVPEWPEERIEYCLTDAGCSKLVVSKEYYDKKADFVNNLKLTVLVIEDILKSVSEDTDKRAYLMNPDRQITGDSLCYCIYTSGSTGLPKGVMIEHGNFRNYADGNPKWPEIEAYAKYGHRVLAVISIAFDFATNDSLLALSHGLSVCVATDEEIHSPELLAKKVIRYKTDVLSCTPSFISNLIDIPVMADALRGMKLYDIGAEAFPNKLYSKIKEVSPKAKIYNGYGPTETTNGCIAKEVTSDGFITIGRPGTNTNIYICDQYMHELPIGAKGELVIGGAGVGRGYINLSKKNAESFVIFNGERVYKSGDLARYLPNGEIEFFGRLDNQVKIRGFRVELDEIENNINSYPGILMSKVLVRNNGSEDYLAAFFTADKKLDLDELKSFLRRKLTYYMVPAAMLQLDEMPLTVNGKIDKKALPEIAVANTNEYVAARTQTETDICAAFASVLKLERVGATDDFFEIGGTSLSATSVVFLLSDKGYNIVYKNLFDYPSPESLAKFLGEERRALNSQAFLTDYDYEGINEVLAKSTMESVVNIKPGKMDNIILTGANGFLGSHILKEYLEQSDGIVTCFIRKGRAESIEKRLEEAYIYYFNESCMKNYPGRIHFVDGDITNKESIEALAEVDAPILINCAASVKHFVRDELLDLVNYEGVKNLTDFCVRNNKRLVQISTTSVGGMTEYGKPLRLSEKDLYIGQYIDNDYVRTKFLAERAVLGAVAEHGLAGRIIRVGNLTSRYSDGEFQMNSGTNNFMRNLKAFKLLGAFPMAGMGMPAEFSPIDSTAKAILRLAFCETDMKIFEAYNNHIINMADAISALRDYGFKISIVSDQDFAERIKEASSNENMKDALLGLIAYRSNDEAPLVSVEPDNRLTVEALYRLDYIWPITDYEYLRKLIKAVDELGFFDE